VPSRPDEILFKLIGFTVSARGGAASTVAISVSIVLLAMAWRIAFG
jgi:hypothetical protein